MTVHRPGGPPAGPSPSTALAFSVLTAGRANNTGGAIARRVNDFTNSQSAADSKMAPLEGLGCRDSRDVPEFGMVPFLPEGAHVAPEVAPTESASPLVASCAHPSESDHRFHSDSDHRFHG